MNIKQTDIPTPAIQPISGTHLQLTPKNNDQPIVTGNKVVNNAEEKKEEKKDEKLSYVQMVHMFKEWENWARGEKRSAEWAADHFLKFVKDILDIKDQQEGIASFLNSLPAQGNQELEEAVVSWKKSTNSLLVNWENIFAEYEIEEIPAPIGDSYNPELHFVCQTVPTSDKQKDGTIVSVDKKGYVLKGDPKNKTIRTAQITTYKYSDVQVKSFDPLKSSVLDF